MATNYNARTLIRRDGRCKGEVPNVGPKIDARALLAIEKRWAVGHQLATKLLKINARCDLRIIVGEAFTERQTIMGKSFRCVSGPDSRFWTRLRMGVPHV